MSTDANSRTFFKKVVFDDWRQYKGVKEFPLSPDGDHHINAIIGENGTGKTTFAKGVEAGLNGSVPGESGDNGQAEPHVNSKVFDQLDDGDSSSGSIELHLSHKGTDYVITREFASRKEDGVCINSIDQNLTVERHTPSEGWEELSNPSKELARILPPEVQQYYFFDGERLDDLFKNDYEDDVRKAVWDLSHVHVLENVINHLRTLRDERRRTAKSSSGEVQEARDERDEKEAERMDIIHEKARVEQTIDEKESALTEIENKMGAAANDQVLSLIEERAELEAEIDSLVDTEEDLEDEVDRLVIEAGSICLAADALDTATEAFDDLGAQGKLPPAVRRKYLDGLLAEKECLCGCDLETHPDHRQNVEDLRNETPAINDRLIEASYEFPNTRTAGEQAFADLRETIRELRETTQERLKKETKVEDLTEQLRGHNIPDEIDLEDLDEQRGQLRTELRKLQNKQGRLEEQLDTVEGEIEALNQRIDRELDKEARSTELMREVNWYKRAREELVAIKAALMAEVRENIEASIETYFNTLTWKTEQYDITVQEDFCIRIDGPDRQRQVERLSAGETELLALSFIAALTEVSGFDAPVMIDTPLARIDQEHRAAIGSRLPDFLADQQVTFLFTDSEFDDTVSSALEGHLANTYKLENANRVTRFEDY